MPDAWNPELYARFAAERAQPFHDLAALLRSPWKADPADRYPIRVIDLGCGNGQLSRELHARLSEQVAPLEVDLLGIDNSSAMIRAALQHTPVEALSLAASPDLRRAVGLPSPRFALGDIARFAEKALLGEFVPFDIVFSNAALHWLPDHPQLFLRLSEAVAPGGQLAVQLPANQHHPSQSIARELASEEPFASALDGYGGESPTTVMAPEDYATLLHELGFCEQEVLLRVYSHVLPGSADVVGWLSGSMLTAYRQKLPQELWESYLAEYSKRLLAVLGVEGSYLLTYNRVLIWGRRGEAG
jgi:trans-aconitate 2-methyltransferase